MNKWTGLVRVCAMIASGVLCMSGMAHVAEEERGAAIGQRHFDAYCAYLLSQLGRAQDSDCIPGDDRMLMAKTGSASAGCNKRGIFKRKPASRTRYTLRYVQP